MITRRFIGSLLGLSFAWAAVACAPDGGPSGRLFAPEQRQARVALTPALDVRSLVDPELGQRILIDRITVNLSEARLLGANPKLPTAGLRLLHEERLLTNNGDGTPAAVLPFPEELLDDSLAIYVQLAGSAVLEGASVIVHARLFELPVSTGTHQLREQAPDPDGDPATGGGDEAPDPDGDPAMGGDKAPDPDGDPAMGDTKRCAPDPDGDPAIFTRCFVRSGLSPSVPSVAFELRGMDEVDLIIGFDESSDLDVVLGIPAARWFTSEVIQKLERALDAAATEPVDAEGVSASERRTVIVATSKDMAMGDGMRPDGDKDDYALFDRREIDPRDLRSR